MSFKAFLVSNLYGTVRFEVPASVAITVATFWDIESLGCHRTLVSSAADFDPEFGGDIFLRNICSHVDYTAL
jgi:hypothetical protein